MSAFQRRSSASRQVKHVRLHLEQLEDRLTPASYYWDAGGDNLTWDDAQNWKMWDDAQSVWVNDVLPGAQDNADLTSASSVQLNGSASVASVLTMSASLTVSGTLAVGSYAYVYGPLDVNGTLSLGAGAQFQISGSGSSISGNVQLAANSVLQIGGWAPVQMLNGASVTGAGQVRFAGWGTYVLDVSGHVTIDNILLESSGVIQGTGTLKITDTMTWTGGNMRGSGTTLIGTDAVLTLPDNYGSHGMHDGRILRNEGFVDWQGGTQFYTSSGTARYENAAGKTWAMGGNGTLWANAAADVVFANEGFLKKTGAQGMMQDATVFDGVALHNFGQFDALVGQIRLNAGGRLQGNALVANGATVHFKGGTFELLPGVVFTGEGMVVVADLGQTALIEVAGNARLSRVEMRNGTIQGTGNLTISAQFTWIQGTLDGSGSLIIEENAVATLVPSEAKTINARRLINRGIIIWQGGDLFLQNDASILNDNNAQFLIQTAADAHLSGAGQSFTNYGLVRKDLGTANLTSDVNFNHFAGQVEVVSGLLGLSGTNQYWAPVDVAAGATLDLGGDPHTFHPGASLTGNGLYRVLSTTFDNQSIIALTPANFELGGLGIITGIGVLAPNHFLWTEGTLRAQVVINGTMTLATAAQKTLEGGVLTNFGQITWLNGEIVFAIAYSEIVNYGIFDIRTDSTIRYAEEDENIYGIVNNAFNAGTGARGRMEKNAGGVVMQFNVPLHNSGRVLLQGFNVDFGKEFHNQNGGELKLGGATMTVAGTLRHHSGSLTDLENGVLVANNSFNELWGGNFIVGNGDLTFAHGVDFTGNTSISLGGGSLALVELSSLYEDAVLTGFGAVHGSLINHGTIDIGGAGIGRITINGTFTNWSGARILIGIAGSGLNQFDQLVVNGTANLGGTVTVAYPTYQYQAGHSFQVVEAVQRVGSFDVLNLPDLGPFNWVEQYQDGLLLSIEN